MGYIKRDDAINASKIVYIEYLELHDGDCIDGDMADIPVVFKSDIEKIPDADVAIVVHGQWVDSDGNPVVWCKEYDCPSDSCYCSVCKSWLVGSDEYIIHAHFCPNCGAKMEEVDE